MTLLGKTMTMNSFGGPLFYGSSILSLPRFGPGHGPKAPTEKRKRDSLRIAGTHPFYNIMKVSFMV